MVNSINPKSSIFNWIRCGAQQDAFEGINLGICILGHPSPNFRHAVNHHVGSKTCSFVCIRFICFPVDRINDNTFLCSQDRISFCYTRSLGIVRNDDSKIIWSCSEFEMCVSIQEIFCNRITNYVSCNHPFVYLRVFFQVATQQVGQHVRSLRMPGQNKWPVIVEMFDIINERTCHILGWNAANNCLLVTPGKSRIQNNISICLSVKGGKNIRCVKGGCLLIE